MPDFADDPTTELERKAATLKWVALAESGTYLLLVWFWLIMPSDAGRAIVGSVHGMVWLAFCSMVIMIAKPIAWSWWYVALVIVTGPLGALLVWDRIRREGAPGRYAPS